VSSLLKNVAPGRIHTRRPSDDQLGRSVRWPSTASVVRLGPARGLDGSAATTKTGRPVSWSSLANGPDGIWVTGIEPALPASESVPAKPVTWPDLRDRVSASDRERPPVTRVNNPLMADVVT
jgi:hypothetical protein